MRDSCSSRESHKSSRSSQEEQPPSQVSSWLSGMVKEGFFFDGALRAGRAMVSSGIGILLRQNMVAGQTFSSCFKLQK